MLEKLKEGRELAQFKNKWLSIMANLGKYNKMKHTYSLNNVERTGYGYKALILIVDGLRYTDLEDIKEFIEDSYGCMCIFNKSKRSNLVNADFIFSEPRKDKFKVIKGLKPWEVYLGNGYNGKPIIIDLVKYPHALITGGTRSGKSKMTDCIITNLICNCSDEELELYLAQVAKSDLVLYEDVKQCRAFSDTLIKTVKMLKHIENKMNERDKLIRPFRKKAKADNYIDYNKITKGNKMSTSYVIFDETSSIFSTNGDKKEDKDLKEEIVGLMRKIAQYGAGLGVFMFCSLQRPDAKNLDTFIKSQSTCNISFRQNNNKSSEIATGDSNIAIGLEQREFVYNTLNNSYGVVPIVDNKSIYNYIKPYIQPGHRTLFTDLKKLSSSKVSREKIEEKPKSTPIEFDMVNKKNNIEKNVSKIEGYIPYKPLENLNIIHEPKIITNTSKPTKGGKEKI